MPVRKPLEKDMAGYKPANSNTRVTIVGVHNRSAPQFKPIQSQNLGLNSQRSRQAMVDRLRQQGISNENVLNAMASVPRHIFVDQGLASRAYEDAALPIGHSQTISQPWVVARMLSALCDGQQAPQKVLEIGTGCGYQAAVMSQLFKQVFTVERIRALYDVSRSHLQSEGYRLVRTFFGDGMLGWPTHAPFDAIVVAAAGLAIPQALLDQLAVKGRLIAPEGSSNQHLVLIERISPTQWQREVLEAVRFVPLLSGVQR
jgi:protein-L-isoaspartate(D-aspartate) O-methyltransferase